MFVSGSAILNGSAAIRGGIPIVFPQFGQGPIMSGQHGFARNQWWDVKLTEDSIQCSLHQNENTLKLWPHAFSLHYTIQILNDHSIKTTFQVENPSDAKDPFLFTALLHNYFSVSDIQDVQVGNLKGLKYCDKVKNNVLVLEEEEWINVKEEVDRMYFKVPEVLVLKEQKAHKQIQINHSFPDAVVWNPWVEKAKKMADFGDEDFRRMVCVETGAVEQPITLQPSQHWTASQTLTII
eukprot:TRINITY_DN18630_c0_g1_i1.p1 TRINITY_DN18630_c0_g1~~TRINITY_DN18630_c0_g1_i1.p1  ORF type:complete len:273 (+),score=70.30 TRINITY_DN18630_c0_g1_i1:109-819(+)